MQKFKLSKTITGTVIKDVPELGLKPDSKVDAEYVSLNGRLLKPIVGEGQPNNRWLFLDQEIVLEKDDKTVLEREAKVARSSAATASMPSLRLQLQQTRR